MESIPLPPILPGSLDLEAINQQLQNGQARLDWRTVISAPERALALLLKNISPSDRCLGLEDNGPAEHIISAIARHYQEQPSPEPTPIPTAKTPVKTSKKIPSPTPSPTVFKKASPAQLRAQLEAAIVKDLLGPAGGETEEIDEARVSERYLVGLLAPKIRNNAGEGEPEQQDEIAIADKENPEEGSTESNVPVADSMFPSSMGMTFCVSPQTQALEITASWGRYDRLESEIIQTDKGNPKIVWKRYPLSGTILQPLVHNGTIDQIPVPDEAPAVLLRGKMRQLGDRDWMVTIFLVNGQQEPSTSKDTAWIFQPQLIVRSADPAHPAIFLKKAIEQQAFALDPLIQAENQAMAMLYRHHVEFAVGHSVGVHAEVASPNPTRAICLSTRVIPTYEVPTTQPPTIAEIPELSGLVLDMKNLAEATTADLKTALQPLTTAYQTWIERQQARIADPNEGLDPYRDTAENALGHCREVLRRIEEGITTLQTNPQAADAFRFMNRAMGLQRIHSLYSERKRRGETLTLDDIDIAKNRSWYPFQLAFILLNLPSTTDLHHPARSHPTDAIADLLWFPTGGGKTEAYLGLTAFTIGLRRLQGAIGGRDGEHGVAVLMRYTLR